MYRRWDGDSDWEQIADIQNADIAPPPTGAIRGWKQAKVLGWSNAGFDEETLLVMDDFVISQNSLIV